MIDWPLVFAAFSGGLAFALGTLAWHERRNPQIAAWLLGGMVVAAVGAMGLAKGEARPEAVEAVVFAEPALPAPRRQLANLAAPFASAPTPTILPLALSGPTLAEVPIPDKSEDDLPIMTREERWVYDHVPIPDKSEDDLPPRLIIPSLNIDKPVVTIHIRNGEWDLENLGESVGRLETTGARPGDSLAMVLAGHVTLTDLRRGAFGSLLTIKRGARVIYRLGDVDYIYAVEAIGRQPPDAVDHLYIADGRTLLLVTCTDWDRERRIYANRLLVRATLVEQRAAGAPDESSEVGQ